MAEEEAFDVVEEEAQIAKEEALPSSAQPGVRVTASSLVVVMASAALDGEVCAV